MTMIENISASQQIYYTPYVNNSSQSFTGSSLTNFDVEDRAIISAQAKMLNELDKFNAGEGNEIDLALATVTGRIQIEAAVNIIKTKEEMMDTLFEMMD